MSSDFFRTFAAHETDRSRSCDYSQWLQVPSQKMGKEKMQMAAEDLANVTLKCDERDEEERSCTLKCDERDEEENSALKCAELDEENWTKKKETAN